MFKDNDRKMISVQRTISCMKIYKIASTDTDIRDLRKDIKDIKSDIKDCKKDITALNKLENRVKKIESTIEGLNIGNRKYWQPQSISTSLQRRIENLESVEIEWKKYKEKMDTKIRREVELRFKAQA